MAETKSMAEQALNCLSGTEQYIVKAFYGFSEYREMSDAEIAGGLNMTKRQVRTIRQGALLKMRKELLVVAV